jgi:hypothetical protein
VIKNQWLQVTVLAGANTGLAAPDVFYFGNLVGETGNGLTAAAVNAMDLVMTRRHVLTQNPAAIARYDIDRDGRVGVLDVALVRANQNRSISLLNAPASAPEPAPAPAPAAAAVFGEASIPRVWDEAPADLLGRS